MNVLELVSYLGDAASRLYRSIAMHYGAWCVRCYAAELIEHDVNQESFEAMMAAASDFSLYEADRNETTWA